MGTCVAFNCKSRSENKIPGITFHGFPKDEIRRKLWVTAVRRQNWEPSKHSKLCSKHFPEEMMDRTSLSCVRIRENAVPSIFDFSSHLQKVVKSRERRTVAVSKPVASKVDAQLTPNAIEPAATDLKVCELHFEPDHVLREASGYDPKTGRTLTAPLKFPRLRRDAVPTLFMPPPGPLVKVRVGGPRQSKKMQPKKEAVKEGTDENQSTNSLQTCLKTESPNVAETSVVIKQEPDESVDELLQPVIDKVLGAEELLSSSRNSPSTSNEPPVLEIALPITDADSTNVDQKVIIGVSNKPTQKRKIGDAALDANHASPDATQVKSRRRAKPSMPTKSNSRLHPSPRTAKKPADLFTSTKNSESATREMFQSLLDGSAKTTLSGSRTSERSGDLFNVFSDFIADKLREMEWDDCAYALRAILDIVFEVGKDKRESKADRDVSSPNSKVES